MSMSIQDLLQNADDAYYSNEFDMAVNLYRQVLQIEPSHERARQQLVKAEMYRIAGRAKPEVPEKAMQYYRQVRSYLAAGDYQSAIKNLVAALEIARAQGQDFPEAERLLDLINNLLVANKSRKNVKDAMQDERWEDALSHMNNVLRYEDDHKLRKRKEALQNLLTVRTSVALARKQPALIEISRKIEETQNILSKISEDTVINQTNLFKEVASSFYSLQNKRTVETGALFLGLAGIIGGLSIGFNFFPGIIVAIIILFIYFVISIYEFSKNNLSARSNKPKKAKNKVWGWPSILLVSIWVLLSGWIIVSSLYILPNNEPADWITLSDINLTYTSPKYLSVGDLIVMEISLTNTKRNEALDGTIKLIFPPNVLITPAPEYDFVEKFVVEPNNVTTKQFKFILRKRPQVNTTFFYIQVYEGNGTQHETKGKLSVSPISHLRSTWSWLVSGSGLVTLIIGFLWEELVNIFRRKEDISGSG